MTDWRLLVLMLCLNTSVLKAEPSIDIRTRFYTVSGTDSASIHRSIQRNGPIGNDGRRYHAYTQWKIDWNYRWTQTQLNCRLSQLSVDLEIHYLLPELQAVESLPSRLRNNWERYYTALYRHEQQHSDYGIQAAQELEQQLSAIGVRPCGELEDELIQSAQRVLDKYRELEKAFDRDTDHGIRQGVMLP